VPIGVASLSLYPGTAAVTTADEIDAPVGGCEVKLAFPGILVLRTTLGPTEARGAATNIMTGDAGAVTRGALASAGEGQSVHSWTAADQTAPCWIAAMERDIASLYSVLDCVRTKHH
jgi:hypothetical protein